MIEVHYELKLITGPTVEPVSFADMQDQLRITATTEQTLIESYITAARRWAEGFQSRAYINQTWDLHLPQFSTTFRGGEIIIPRAPLSSVTSIKYVDIDGNQQTLATTVYQINTAAEPGRIKVEYGQSWPCIRASDYKLGGPVTVRFVAGYGSTATSVPAEMKQALKLLAGHWYETREEVTDIKLEQIPMGMRHLLWLKRLVLVP